jgi:PPOX class probable F420-dependent enzyme
MRQTYIVVVTVLAGVFTAAIGFWALLAPGSFADFIDFPPENEHLLHDVGAFQLGLGATLLLATAWADGLAVALAGFFVANTAHTVNHATDIELGGRDSDSALLGILSILVAVALVLRLGQLGYVVGRVRTAASTVWAPFVRQKTIAITTYKRDGSPSTSPISIAVDGDHGYVRTWHTSWKAKRLRRNPSVLIAPSTAKGRPTGPAIHAKARLLDGADALRARRLIGAKYPLLQAIVVPLAHRLMRVRTQHYELTASE